jgi:hypothetical protein
LGTGSLHRHVQIVHQKENGAFFEIEEKDTKLIGRTTEENLYLAYLHLAHKKYKQAYELLNQRLSGNPRGYSEKEKEIMQWFVDLIEQSQDESPQAKAISLQVFYLQLRNQAGSETADFKSALAKRISDALEPYYPLKQDTKNIPLTHSQELGLLEFLQLESVLSSILQKRYHLLTNNQKQEAGDPMEPASTQPLPHATELHPPLAEKKADNKFPVLKPQASFSISSSSTQDLLKKHLIILQEVAILEQLGKDNPLTAVFDLPKNSDKVIQREFKRIQSSVQANDKDLAQAKRYQLEDPQLIELSKVFKSTLTTLQSTIDQQKIKLLALVNKESDDLPQALTFSSMRLI